MFALASRVLDRQDDDLFRCLVEDIVDEIRITTCHELADTFGLLAPADQRKKSKSLERFEDRRADTPCGLRISLSYIVGNTVEVLYRLASKAKLHLSKRRNASSSSASLANSRRSA